MVSLVYGKTTGLCVDPVEKKPLYHFYPGSRTLSFGTTGCNMGCVYCQNWHISKSDNINLLQVAEPYEIAETADRNLCDSVSFTYNEPIIFAEYAIDTARQCQERGIKTVAVTAGYILSGAREDFFGVMDAANVDLKAFSKRFYKKLCLAELDTVLETLKYIRKETNVWLEITNLLIPGENDSDEEIEAMTGWIADELGKDVPLHFSAFHPDYKLKSKDRTSVHTLRRARDIAFSNGLKYVYSGNVIDKKSSSTYCPGCSEILIDRRGYDVRIENFQAGTCLNCNTEIKGRF